MKIREHRSTRKESKATETEIEPTMEAIQAFLKGRTGFDKDSLIIEQYHDNEYIIRDDEGVWAFIEDFEGLRT